VSLGFIGKQSAKRIHAATNTISRSYTNIHDKVLRLKCILEKHYRQICPVLASQQPIAKRRKNETS